MTSRVGSLPLAALVAATSAALLLAAAAVGANQPGDPCSTEGATADLNGGKIKCVGGAWQPSAGGAPGTPGTPATAPAGSPGAPAAGAAAASIKTAAIFTSVGTVLSQDTFASTGRQVADSSTIRLPDGRLRIYAFVSPDGIRSATSIDTTGTAFTADAGRRITWAPGGQPRAVVLADGRVRLFYLDAGSILSAISPDGLTFTDEGPRITTAQAGFEPGGISVVTFGGGYRAYFSNLEKPGVRAERVARTATSPDMLTWTVGPIITGTAGSIKDGASHPFAVVSGKTIALYFNGDRSSFYGTLRATSTDGITFGDERAILKGAGDPNLVSLPGGTTLLYYGAQVAGKGFGIAVARATVNPVTGQGATAKAATATVKAPAKTPAKVPTKAAIKQAAPATKPTGTK